MPVPTDYQDRSRIIGTVYWNKDPSYTLFPYLVKFDDPRHGHVFTNMAGHNARQGDYLGTNSAPDDGILVHQAGG